MDCFTLKMQNLSMPEKNDKKKIKSNQVWTMWKEPLHLVSNDCTNIVSFCNHLDDMQFKKRKQ